MTTVYNTRTSLAAYVDGLYSPTFRAISRILAASDGYLQKLVNEAQTAETQATSAAQTATTAATTASTAATNAQNYYNKTDVLFVSFGKLWYGDHPSDPTDNPNTGGPLNIGARYWNTTSNKIRIYTSTGWQDFDAQAEQLQQEASISASQAAKYAAEAAQEVATAQTLANTLQADIDQIQNDLKELEALFTLPLPANDIPQVNPDGTGFNFIKPGLLGVTAWNSTLASNGGYPQYAVVCDPTMPGVLYESKVSSNSDRPYFTSSNWSFFTSSSHIPVTAFGVVNDPTGQNVEANTQAYRNAIKACAGSFTLVHPLDLTVVVEELSISYVSNLRWELNGTLILNNNVNFNVITLFGEIHNFYLFGSGTINGSLNTNTQTNMGNVIGDALGACIAVNGRAGPDGLGNSVPLSTNINIEGLTLKNAQYAFFGNNCQNSSVRKCIATQTTYGIIFSNGDSNVVENNIASWNAQLGIGLNNTVYNSSIQSNRVFSNWNQGLNIWADNEYSPPQFCIVRDNFVHDNGSDGLNVNSGAGSNLITDLKVLNNVFQNNVMQGSGNDICATGVNELMISGNLLDRCCNAYKGKLSSAPNSVWIHSDCEQIDIHSNTFKNVGSSINYGIQLWLNNPTRGTVHSNTFMDTMAVTQGWIGGAIETDSQVNYNINLGGLQSSSSTEASQLPIFQWDYNGYSLASPSSSNNNQSQCTWTPQFPTGLSWAEILGTSQTVSQGNTQTLQQILGSYSSYSLTPPTLQIVSIIVNDEPITLNSSSSSVSLADLDTITCVSSEDGSGWQIMTGSGELVYSLGSGSGIFPPGFCLPPNVVITWEVSCPNTVDGSTVPTVPTSSTTDVSFALISTETAPPPTSTSSTSSSDTGVAPTGTVYAGNYWNTQLTCNISTYLNIPNTTKVTPIISYPTYPTFYTNNNTPISTSSVEMNVEWVGTSESSTDASLYYVGNFYTWTPSFRTGLSWRTLIGSPSNITNEFVYPVLRGSDHLQIAPTPLPVYPIRITSVQIDGQTYTYAGNGNLSPSNSTSNSFVIPHPKGGQIHGVVLSSSDSVGPTGSTSTPSSYWIGIEYTTGELCLGMGYPGPDSSSDEIVTFDLPASLQVTFEITNGTSGSNNNQYSGVPFTVTPCLKTSSNSPTLSGSSIIPLSNAVSWNNNILYIPTSLGTIAIQASGDYGWIEGGVTWTYPVPYKQVFASLSAFIGRDYGAQNQGYGYGIGTTSAWVSGCFAGKFIVVGIIEDES